MSVKRTGLPGNDRDMGTGAGADLARDRPRRCLDRALRSVEHVIGLHEAEEAAAQTEKSPDVHVHVHSDAQPVQ